MIARIEQWCRKSVLALKARTVELRIVTSGREEPAQTFVVPRRNADFTAFATDISDVLNGERAAMDAPVMTARLVAFNDEGAGVASMRLRIKDEERGKTLAREDDHNLTDHSKDDVLRAIAAQQMRHNDALVKQLVQVTASQHEGYRTAIDHLSQRLALAEDRAMRLSEESYAAAEGRELSEMKIRAWDTAAKYIPVLVNEIAVRSGKLPAQSMPPQLIAALESLTPEQIQGMAAICTAEQMQVFAGAVRSAVAPKVTALPGGKKG